MSTSSAFADASVKRMSAPSAEAAMTIVRVTAGVLLGIHGYYRLFAGGVVPFGGYLDSTGIPLGHAVAWAITIFEMVGSILLVVRRFVVPVAVGQILILASGIALVHAPAGWFVVGGGRNGVEYSVLLIACLVAAIVAHRTAPGAEGAPG